jgi:hypothetical protein
MSRSPCLSLTSGECCASPRLDPCSNGAGSNRLLEAQASTDMKLSMPLVQYYQKRFFAAMSEENVTGDVNADYVEKLTAFSAESCRKLAL